MEFLDRGIDGYRFSFFVVSAAPQRGGRSRRWRDRPVRERIFGTEFEYDPTSGEVRAIARVPAGYGKVSVLEELEERLGTEPERTIYVGDGSSDVHVMLHVNNREGFTIAVSENKLLARIAKSTVLSDSAFSVLVPDTGADRGLAPGRDPRALRVLRADPSGLGEGAHRPRHRPRAAAPVGTAVADVERRRPSRWAGRRRPCSRARTSASGRRLRRVQMAGALMWVVYGALLQVAPVVAANLLVLAAAAWTARRER